MCSARLAVLVGSVDRQRRWCNCWTVAPENLTTTIVRFPRACPKCRAIAALPSRAGTLAERRTQVDLRCTRCRHEWSLEMTPPVLIVNPDRETDDETFDRQTVRAEEFQTGNRRDLHDWARQRMRVGLCGLLRSTDRTHTVTVLYSLDPQRVNGRLRLMDPGGVSPAWLAPRRRLWLSGYDGLPMRIRITTVKPRHEGGSDDEHFAEFVVPQVEASANALHEGI